MLIIGLTGSIAMGKSTAGNYLIERGLPLFSADDTVHELYRHEAVDAVGAVFPGVVKDAVVDRKLLSQTLMAEPQKIKQLEAIVHPLVSQKRREFIADHRTRGSNMIILDIPLLFEKQLQDSVDVTLLVTAPASMQVQRAMKRPGMTAEKLEMIQAHQMPDDEKRQRADFIIDTSGSFEQTQRKLDEFLESVHVGTKNLGE